MDVSVEKRPVGNKPRDFETDTKEISEIEFNIAILEQFLNIFVNILFLAYNLIKIEDHIISSKFTFRKLYKIIKITITVFCLTLFV